MALRFSGGPYANYVFAQSAGTRAEIVAGVVTGLQMAGWTIVSSATADYTLTSKITPENLQINVRVYDAGSGTDARIAMKPVSGSITTQDFYLRPGVGKHWRVLACPYQFFISTGMSQVNAAEFVAGGTLALPPWLVGVTTTCGWMNGNALNDGGGQVYCLRNGWLPGNASYYTKWSGIMNTNLVDRSANNDYYDQGDLIFTCQRPGRATFSEQGYRSSYPAQRWVDGSVAFSDCCAVWGSVSPATSSEGTLQGQLWDAAACSVVYPAENIIQLGTHQMISIMHNNNAYGGPSGGTYTVPGTLFVAFS